MAVSIWLFFILAVIRGTGLLSLWIWLCYIIIFNGGDTPPPPSGVVVMIIPVLTLDRHYEVGFSSLGGLGVHLGERHGPGAAKVLLLVFADVKNTLKHLCSAFGGTTKKFETTGYFCCPFSEPEYGLCVVYAHFPGVGV
jgi:hypothetical protein